jgi:2-C-methyl-D-erythritol 4-phosphate cytidylyltransferase
MASQTERARYWAIIPAAGVGRRMRSDIPKQYLPLADRTVLEHTLHRIALHPLIAEIVVVISDDDTYWDDLYLDWVAKPVKTAPGGTERCHSVLNGLQAISQQADDNDWVLVHDAARPCVRPDDIDKLITQCRDDVGGILAVPVSDTMKQRSETGLIDHTVDRSNLWHALTPQMFRLGKLRDALQAALDKKILVTDEAMAMEQAGYKPRLVEGHADNIKITRPEDLALAAFFLRQQQEYGIDDFDDGLADGG